MHCKLRRGYFIMLARQERTIRYKAIMLLAALLACLLAVPGRAGGAELNPEAAQGFDRYVHVTERRMQTELRPGGAFLWVDGLPEERHKDALMRMQNTDVVTGHL